jgi:trk system potassium uptake protein TrkH
MPDLRYRPWLHQWDVRGHSRDAWRALTPAQLLAGSFLGLITLGTFGLRWLPGLYTGPGLGWLDAVFTATSAVCVTGLIVVDTATYFTPAGQAFLLLLIQLGGLGIIAFTTLIILALGRRLSLQHEEVTAGNAHVAPLVDYRHLARSIIIFTFALEAVGAVLLWLLWEPRLGQDAIWHAVFHAISAFCNAGFSTFSDSLIGFQREPGVLIAISALIIVGGLGFLAMDELYLALRARRFRRQRSWQGRITPRLSLHTRLVLATTLLLLLGGWLGFALFEWNVSLRGMSIGERLANAWFMSVTPRTAGFNSIDYATATDPGNFLTILLMSIGGSSGSTAGGLKTTTVAVIGLLALARFRGYTAASIWGRTIPDETIQRAVGLFVVAFGVVTLAILALISTEVGFVAHGTAGAGLLPYMFETASAFNTVGLSMGITADLSPGGRALLTVLMYIGRIGPLTFAAAIALRRRTLGADFRYAQENVVIG